MPVKVASILAMLGLLAACADSGSTTTVTAGPGPTTTASTTPSTTPTTAPVGGCGAGEPMVESGPIVSLSEVSSDAEQISGIAWQTVQTCERFTIEFANDQGAPATTAPGVDAELIREVGVLRVAVDVEMTTISDQLVESSLVDQIYVVRQTDRSLFVDFHLSAPAAARVGVAGSPARVSVELEPGGMPYPAAPALGPNVVLISPSEGLVEVPVVLNGYSRSFEANTVGRITQGDEVLAEGFTTAADWTETWGEFSLTLAPSGSGEAELFAGEQSPKDGSDQGVVVTITLP
jgi:hypothetical protein